MAKSKGKSSRKKRGQAEEVVQCPHLHFKADIIDRNVLSKEQHLNLLSTPKGYRWDEYKKESGDGGPSEEFSAPRRIMCSGRRMKKAEKVYVHNFLAEVWNLLTPEMVDRLKGMLMNEFGMSPQEADDFICKQREENIVNSSNVSFYKKPRDIGDGKYTYDHVVKMRNPNKAQCDKIPKSNLGFRNSWIKDFSDFLSDLMSTYVLNTMCTKRTDRQQEIAQTLLNRFNASLELKTSMTDPKTPLDKTLVLLADRLATWLDDNVNVSKEAAQKIKTFKEMKPKIRSKEDKKRRYEDMKKAQERLEAERQAQEFVAELAQDVAEEQDWEVSDYDEEAAEKEEKEEEAEEEAEEEEEDKGEWKELFEKEGAGEEKEKLHGGRREYSLDESQKVTDREQPAGATAVQKEEEEVPNGEEEQPDQKSDEPKSELEEGTAQDEQRKAEEEALVEAAEAERKQKEVDEIAVVDATEGEQQNTEGGQKNVEEDTVAVATEDERKQKEEDGKEVATAEAGKQKAKNEQKKAEEEAIAVATKAERKQNKEDEKAGIAAAEAKQKAEEDEPKNAEEEAIAVATEAERKQKGKDEKVGVAAAEAGKQKAEEDEQKNAEEEAIAAAAEAERKQMEENEKAAVAAVEAEQHKAKDEQKKTKEEVIAAVAAAESKQNEEDEKAAASEAENPKSKDKHERLYSKVAESERQSAVEEQKQKEQEQAAEATEHEKQRFEEDRKNKLEAAASYMETMQGATEPALDEKLSSVNFKELPPSETTESEAPVTDAEDEKAKPVPRAEEKSEVNVLKESGLAPEEKEQRTIEVLKSVASIILETKVESSPRQEALEDIVGKQLDKRLGDQDQRTIHKVSSKVGTWIDKMVDQATMEYAVRESKGLPPGPDNIWAPASIRSQKPISVQEGMKASTQPEWAPGVSETSSQIGLWPGVASTPGQPGGIPVFSLSFEKPGLGPWIKETLEPGILRVRAPLAQRPKGSTFHLSRKDRGFDVRMISNTLAQEKIRLARGKSPAYCNVPNPDAPLEASDIRSWYKWTSALTEVAESWAGWIKDTIEGTQQKGEEIVRDNSPERMKEWREFIDGQAQVARKWQQTKKEMERRAEMWTRKGRSQ